MATSVCDYLSAHRVLLSFSIALMCSFLSAVFGDFPLPNLSFLSDSVPPVTIDAVLALGITAATVVSLTAPIAYFEEVASSRWRVADAVLITVHCAPAFIVAALALSPTMLARDVAVYFIITILVGALSSMEAGLVVCSLWLVIQSAAYGSFNDSWAEFFVIILNDSPPFLAWVLAPVVLCLWLILGRPIKLGTA